MARLKTRQTLFRHSCLLDSVCETNPGANATCGRPDQPVSLSGTDARLLFSSTAAESPTY